MLDIGRHLNAKDARAHVYAILGMCDPMVASADSIIVPNY